MLMLHLLAVTGNITQSILSSIANCFISGGITDALSRQCHIAYIVCLCEAYQFVC